MDFQELRKEYESAGINADALPDSPYELLNTWLEEATGNSPGKWFEPNAMALATADLSGHVTNRWVLLKGVSEEGIKFYTNYGSTKGKQLAANPQAAVSFHWPYLGRQLRIEGVTEKTSREESEQYFHSRPRGSQIGALASEQSRTIESRELLESRRNELEKELDGREVPLPESWGGYLLRPVRFEFWQGRLDRLHDRVVYLPRDDANEKSKAISWRNERLCP